MCDSVEEIDRGPRPLINSDAIKVYDNKSRILYIYGGTPWPANDNDKSPTNRPTSDFFCLSFGLSPSWKDYSISMREDESLISPFKDELSFPEKSGLELPRLGALPTLQDPIGTIVHDETASRTSYLLILGDPVGKSYEKYNHPILLCINLRLNTWRKIKLKDTRKVPDGRARASMVVVGEMRSQQCDMFLCVFGGVKEGVNDEVNTITSLNSFAIANLSKGVWTVPNRKVPDAVGPLGIRPGLVKFWDAQQNREMILILRGAVERHGVNTEISAEATFSEAFLFDPRVHKFTKVRNDSSSRFPSPAKAFTLQPSQASRIADSSYLLVTWSDQRGLNEIPPRPDEPEYRERVDVFYHAPQVELWIAEIQHLVEDSEMVSDPEQELHELDTEETSEEDDESSSEEEGPDDSILNHKGKRTSVLTQKAKRSGSPVLRMSGVTLIWRNVTYGRVKKSLTLLSPSFRIEAAFLSGDIPSRLSLPAYVYDHPLSPRLVLLGCDHEFLGEIFGDIYNAFASISLHSLLDSEEEEAVSSLVEDGMTSAGVTPEHTVSDSETLLHGDNEPEFTAAASEAVDEDMEPAPNATHRRRMIFSSR